MGQQTPIQAIREARQMAKDYGMFVVEKSGRFLLYRETKPRNTFLGARSDVRSFRAFVERCAYGR